MRFLTLACRLSVLLAFAVPPPSASAGTFEVTACFGPENGSWSEWEPSPGVTAYTACPGGTVDVAHPQAGDGMIVRNVVGPGFAATGAAAALRFDAPGGTTITGVGFDARLLRNPGWQVGIQDAASDRWLWCGDQCSTSSTAWVRGDLRGLATPRLAALVRCVGARCRRDARHAFIGLRNVRVALEDSSPPALGTLRGVGDGWLRGPLDVGTDASDNSGIRAVRAELAGGTVVHAEARPCDFSRPVPCANGAIAAKLDTRTWPDGEHRLRVGAQDAAGNWAWTERVARVDNTAPAEPAPALDGGETWNPARERTVRIALADGQVAPLVRARVTACRVEVTAAAAAGCAASSPELGAGGTLRLAAESGPGEYAVRVALEDAAGNVGPAAPPFTLRFDDAVPAAPDLAAADHWLPGTAPLELGAPGAAPVSGVRGFKVRVDDGTETLVTAPASPARAASADVTAPLPLDALREGGTPIEVRTLSGAGVASTTVRTLVRIDRSAPAVAALAAPSPQSWSRSAVQIGLRGHDQAGLAGVASLAWRIGDSGETTVRSDEAVMEIGADGRHDVAFRAFDHAGNASEPQVLRVNVDRTPPETVAFEAPDPADPTLVRALVADATSGVAGGVIELRPAGGDWTAIDTSLRDGRLAARIDDATLRAGTYELRARALDAAGNESIGTARVDGAPAALALPLRRPVSLTTTRTGATLDLELSDAGGPLAGRELLLAQRMRGRSVWGAVCERTAILAGDRRASDAFGSAAPAPLSAIAGASPAVPGRACPITTDAAGRVRVRLRPGPSRTLRATFSGDAVLLPARATATVRTRARVSLRAGPDAVRAGGSVRFSGRLRGGHLPAAGKVVELQARVGAGWRTFVTLRSDRRGRVRHVHRFRRSSTGRTYWFRLLARRESAYPFDTGSSRPVAVSVL